MIKRRLRRECPKGRRSVGQVETIIEELTTDECTELADLIIESPPTRVHAAVRRIAGGPAPHDIPRWPNVIEWLLYLDERSSGVAFDRAVLQELRRLSLH